MIEKVHVESSVLTEYWEQPCSQKSSTTLGERLSKDTRTKLVNLCIKGILEEQQTIKPVARGIGRPRSAESLLADKVNVTTRAVRKWVREHHRRASDVNSDALTRISYSYYPKETAHLLREDAESYLMLVDSWLRATQLEYREQPCSQKSASR